jgi:Spy/CpxP family protein refolding chaperone
MMQLQRESQDKTLGVLTPEQTKKLKELTEKGLPGLGQPGQAAEQPKGK